MQKATCDKCGKDFTIKLREEQRGISIKINYFRCSNCKEKYIAFVTDPECRKMQREIAAIRGERNQIAAHFARDEINELEYRRRIDASDAKIKQIQRELEPRMNKLKEMYS